jgi:DNA/RNA endonuclease YhcR with UshA esterase domain
MNIGRYRLRSVFISLLLILLLCVIPACNRKGEPFTSPGSSSAAPNYSKESSSELPPESTTISEIQWNEAGNYIGVEVIVCGPVVDSKWASGSNGKPTFLNIGKPYPDPDRFTIVIWEEYRDNFPEYPEEFYLGKTVCVTGIVDEYNGSAQIELRSPARIEIK